MKYSRKFYRLSATHYALFNFGGMLWGSTMGKCWSIENRQIAHNRYPGNLAGFGISYGYQWIISPQWNLEAGISIGYAHLNYKRYGQSEGCSLLEKIKLQLLRTYKQNINLYISSDKST